MPYAVHITPLGQRTIRKLPPNIQVAILALLTDLQDNPRPPGYKKLAGTNQYRVRFGDYRIIYEIRDKELLVTILKAAHRREAYR